MVVKEGEVPMINGKVKLPIPEHTLFGTYFIGSNKDNAVKSIVFKNDTLQKKAPCAAVWQYLAGNLNKPLTLSYSPTQGIDKTLTGKASAYDLYSGMLTLATDAGRTVMMHSNSVYQVDFKETPNTYYWADSIQRMIVINPEKPASSIRLQQVHLTGNVNWLPSYYLQLKDSKTARIEMKAMVENFAEDLNDAETELVVGAPQMIYSNTPDPMTYDYISVHENTGSYGRGAGARMYMQSNAVAKAALEETDGAAYFEGDFETGGEKSGDMYIYKIGKVSLPKNSKGSFPVFAANVEYKDKYEGTVGDITNFYNNRYVPDEEKVFDVFHSLEIKNTTSVPLTTASLMAVNDKGQFMAQDELKYTPVGSLATIRLSKAIDIVAKNNEEEKTREDNAKKVGKASYSKVILAGTITVENFQDKASTVSIIKLLNGTVLTQNQNGKTSKKASYNYINPQSEIKWEIDLGAKQKKTIAYEYEVFFLP